MSLIALALAASLPPVPGQWAQFGRGAGLGRSRETVDIGIADRKDSGQYQYELRLTRQVSGKPDDIKRADSIACPVIHTVMASMHTIAMPSPAPYGVPGRPRTMILDGTAYFLTAPSTDSMGKITISSNLGSPLTRWVDASLKELELCWLSTAQ